MSIKLPLVAVALLVSTAAHAQISYGGGVPSSAAYQPTGQVVTSGASATMTTQTLVVNKSTGSATAITLPASPTPWLLYTVTDGKGDAATNNITVTPTSGTINAGPNVVLNQSGASLIAYFDGTNWHID